MLTARYGEVLDRPDVDAVIIATPDFAHTPILIEATKRHKDAYVEKPMSTLLDHATGAVPALALLQGFHRRYTGAPGAHLIDVGLWFMDDPLPRSAGAHGGVYVWKGGREHADTLDCVLDYPKEFILTYSTRLGNKHAVPEVTFYGTKGTFDTESWTARGEGGGAGALDAPVIVPASAPERASAAAGGAAASGLAATQNDPRLRGDDHMLNWLECVRTRATPNAPVEVGYAHSVASILCFEALNTGRRQIFDATKRTIRAE